MFQVFFVSTTPTTGTIISTTTTATKTAITTANTLIATATSMTAKTVTININNNTNYNSNNNSYNNTYFFWEVISCERTDAFEQVVLNNFDPSSFVFAVKGCDHPGTFLTREPEH